MAGKRPRQEPSPCSVKKGARQQIEIPVETSQHQEEEKITVSIIANLWQCFVCSGPLTPPLFQCMKGHVSCSKCCTDGKVDDNVECHVCREPETVTRCRAMERVLSGLLVPCPFQKHGCAEMVPYASEQAHKAACAHAPLHCPISGCAGYAGNRLLREHVQQDHPGLVRTLISPRSLTPLKICAHEQARVVMLGDGGGGGGGAEFLVVVGQYKELGRALSLVRLVDEPVDELDDQDFKYKIEVVGRAGVLSLSGATMDAERLAEPYEANPFLFVPNEIWDSSCEGSCGSFRGEPYFRVFVELK